MKLVRQRVSGLRNKGWSLSGNPAWAFDPIRHKTICGPALVRDVPGPARTPSVFPTIEPLGASFRKRCAKLSIAHNLHQLRSRTGAAIVESWASVVIPCRAPEPIHETSDFRQSVSARGVGGAAARKETIDGTGKDERFGKRFKTLLSDSGGAIGAGLPHRDARRER